MHWALRKFICIRLNTAYSATVSKQFKCKKWCNVRDYATTTTTTNNNILPATTHLPCQLIRPMNDFNRTPCRWYAKSSKTADKVRGIQKDILPLTTRRIVRKKKSRDSVVREREMFDVRAYATAEALGLESLADDINAQGLYNIIKLPTDVVDALYVEANYRLDDEPRDILFFREGTMVFWNVPVDEQQTVLQFVRQHQEHSYDRNLVAQEVEQIEFAYTDNDTKLAGDEIHLGRTEDKDSTVRHLEKYAFSNALSLSVKLSIWEASLERFVESIEWMLRDLKDGNKIRISRAQALRKTGELFDLRHMVNLSSDLLDTPDFYWDREDVEPLYTRTCNHLTIARRTRVMNEKLTHCCELMTLLRDHLNDKHHTQLEWMIIILIMVEVGFEILHLIQNAITSSGS